MRCSASRNSATLVVYVCCVDGLALFSLLIASVVLVSSLSCTFAAAVNCVVAAASDAAMDARCACAHVSISRGKFDRMFPKEEPTSICVHIPRRNAVSTKPLNKGVFVEKLNAPQVVLEFSKFFLAAQKKRVLFVVLIQVIVVSIIILIKTDAAHVANLLAKCKAQINKLRTINIVQTTNRRLSQRLT